MRRAHGGYAFLGLHHMVVRVCCLCSLTIESGLDERGSPRPPGHAIDGLWHALAETNMRAYTSDNLYNTLMTHILKSDSDYIRKLREDNHPDWHIILAATIGFASQPSKILPHPNE